MEVIALSDGVEAPFNAPTAPKPASPYTGCYAIAIVVTRAMPALFDARFEDPKRDCAQKSQPWEMRHKQVLPRFLRTLLNLVHDLIYEPFPKRTTRLVKLV